MMKRKPVHVAMYSGEHRLLMLHIIWCKPMGEKIAFSFYQHIMGA